MDELLASVDALAAEDLSPLFGPALLERLRPLLVLANRIDAEIARTVAECDGVGAAEHDGLKTMGSWLRGHGHLSDSEAARVVRAARALTHLPAMAAAFAAGEVTAEQAAVLGTIAEPRMLALAADQGVDVAAFDELLTGVARQRPYADTTRVVRHYADRLDADGPEPDPTEGRRLSITRHADGSVSGRFDLDAVGGERFTTAVEAITQAGRCAADQRTRTQQQADALVQLSDTALATGALPVLRGHKPQVIVTIGIADLTDAATGPGAGRLASGAEISATAARRLACDAAVTRVVLHPDGRPLDHGRDVRLFPAHVRRAAEVRDGGCVFAGCGAPTWWCDVHHLIAWIDGGPTDLDNAALLCERHHTKVHHGFRVQRDTDGRWHTWRPDGTPIRTGPIGAGPSSTGPGSTPPPLTTAA
ncbi:HNH endonuclease signature motif containing protein [Geodermatophilus sp. DSM 44513]|uniref:HNH endonuclease signature motif containing protein n=1 Tax=Geodermatophilus sp. DSM 44513 TaxID=1528104 RepID=UPI001275A55D|nr:HNH endonuclease signature motif containing protein [Geodermatophilus sp. DSM 44513]WNV77378.1 DUF222 domain-containing protein [Geodermatophilus sp. DSM 44513]